jgi:hypothetical protein
VIALAGYSLSVPLTINLAFLVSKVLLCALCG